MGKKKDKLYKLEPETKAMIAAVRSAVEDCAATGLYGRFMGFEESHTTDDYRLTAVFDCGEYRLRLRYLPSVMLLTDNFLDIDLDYGDAGRFTLYDVFNVLEIEDFNQYYHSGFSTTGEVPGLVRELLEAVHKYDYDLRRAAEPQLLAQMKANRLADMKAVRGKHFDPNDPDGEEQEILGILPTHPMVTAVSGATDSAKLLRHLEKAEAKGRLDTLYERRLLDYMRRGHTVVDKTEQKKQDFERQYRRCVRKVNAIFALAALVVGMALVFGLRAILFRGTVIAEYILQIGSLQLPGATMKCVLLGLISALGVYSFAKSLLGIALMKRPAPVPRWQRLWWAWWLWCCCLCMRPPTTLASVPIMCATARTTLCSRWCRWKIGTCRCIKWPVRSMMITANLKPWITAMPLRTAGATHTMWAIWRPAAIWNKSCFLSQRKTATQ